MAWRDPWDTVDKANALRTQQDAQGVNMLSSFQGMQHNALQASQFQEKVAKEKKLQNILAQTDPKNLEPAIQELWKGGFFDQSQALRKQAQEMQQDAAFSRFFNGGQSPVQSQPGGSQAPPQSLQTPQAQQASGSPLDELDPQSAATIRALAASGDRKGAITKLFEALQPKLSTDGRAVITRGGKVMAAPGAVEAFTAFQNAQRSTEANYAPPVTMKLGDRDVQVFPSEFPQVKTGQLPERLGGPPADAPSLSQPEFDEIIKRDMLRNGISQAKYVYGNDKTGEVLARGKMIDKRAVRPEPSQDAPRLGVGETKPVAAANEDIAKRATEHYAKSAENARISADSVRSIQEARSTIDKGAFMGSGAEYKLAIAKFANDVLGVPLDTEKATNSNYLKSTLGTRLLEQAKTLGSNPSNADAARIDSIVGSLSTDRNAMRKILDWNEEMARRVIENHGKVKSKIDAQDYAGALSVGTEAPPSNASRAGALPSLQDIEAELQRRGVK
jgi:hypothetical protein